MSHTGYVTYHRGSQCSEQTAEPGKSPAQELIICSHVWARSLISQWAEPTAMKQVDIEDVQQECLLALKKASQRFQAERPEAVSLSAFRSFAFKVLRDSFVDYLRRYLRQEAHMDRSQSATEILHRLVDPANASNPAVAIIANERRMILTSILGALEPEDRFMLQEYASGTQLRDIAEELGRAYTVTKRRWQTISRKLRGSLVCCRE